jgi:hypothetical protein
MVKLVNVTPQAGSKLHLEYDDGTSGKVDLSNVIGKGVFAALRDTALFERVTIGEHGEVQTMPARPVSFTISPAIAAFGRNTTI